MRARRGGRGTEGLWWRACVRACVRTAGRARAREERREREREVEGGSEPRTVNCREPECSQKGCRVVCMSDVLYCFADVHRFF